MGPLARHASAPIRGRTAARRPAGNRNRGSAGRRGGCKQQEPVIIGPPPRLERPATKYAEPAQRYRDRSPFRRGERRGRRLGTRQVRRDMRLGIPRQAASRSMVPVFCGMSGWYRAMRIAVCHSRSVGRGEATLALEAARVPIEPRRNASCSASPGLCDRTIRHRNIRHRSSFCPSGLRGRAGKVAARSADGRAARRKEGRQGHFNLNGGASAPQLPFLTCVIGQLF